ncbi:MAG: NADH-quinone oxidoreductase subunit NuoN [Acidiferrobacteraceae bacterium]|nr:NADH-quinone oxidoreductase subunit NuoN [Acidiferrobacteraceae bacterium]
MTVLSAHDFWAVAPEIYVATLACVILVIDLYVRSVRPCAAAYPLTIATLVSAGLLCLDGLFEPTQTVLNGLVMRDSVSALLKSGTCFGTAAVLFYARDYAAARGLWRGEYLVLALFGVVGMMAMIGAAHLLTLYVGIELLALCLYGMIAMERDSVRAAEAAMKYFILGALASGVLLYGMSLLYGLTGSLSLQAVSGATGTLEVSSLPLMLAISMLVVGLLFKLGAVPFHMWVPDVYDGSATSTTLYLSAVPKLAAFAILLRLLSTGLEGWIEIWQDMLLVAALLSIALGNVVAIAQSNIKRMLAYSTISNMGFLLLGFFAGTHAGYAAAMFYAVIYMVTTLAAFSVILALSRSGFESDSLDDFRGLNKRNPWLALLMLIVMFSLAGIPPTAGFFAKLMVLQAALEAGFVAVVVAAVILAVVGAFYYLRIVKLMYFDDAEEGVLTISAHGYRRSMKWVLTVNAIGLVAVTPWIGEVIDFIGKSLMGFGLS